MNYANREMKIDQLISYINDGKINLIPKFQRGQVWTPILRKKLLANMVLGRPIPAIFLYKEEVGSKFAYNILDGKQRLESLILFVGDKRPELAIKDVASFFADLKVRRLRNFKVDLEGTALGFAGLDEKLVRDFREYAIPTIEISLEDSSVDEIVQLFVDINSYGVKVSRFDVAKAMGKDPLLGSVLDLIAVRQIRRKSVFYKAKSNPFVRVLRKQTIIARSPTANARVDRMWERLTEIALYTRTRKHKAPTAILNSFIKGGENLPKLTASEVGTLRGVFSFLANAYARSVLGESKLATDQPRLYTMICSLLDSDLMTSIQLDELSRKLNRFSAIIDNPSTAPAELQETITTYTDLAEKQTTNSGRRDDRQKKFIEAIKAL
jgi:hypothetical protein